MKKSNIIKFVLACMVLVPSVNSCQEFKMDVQEAQPLALKCDALAEYTANATAPGNIVFNISSNTPWEITSDVQWLSIDPKMSASSSLVAEITVAMEDNTGKEARTATLNIIGEGLETTQSIKITQSSKESLLVIPYTETVPTLGATISFKMTSNKAWEIIPSADFVSNINKKSGEGSLEEETIEVTVPENKGARRTASLTVKTAFEEFTFDINQDGYVLENAEDPEVTTFDFSDGLASEQIVKIAANLEWKAVVDKSCENWLAVEKIDEETLKIKTLSHNTIFTPRSGKVILKPAKPINGFDNVEFTVNQGIAFWFAINNDETMHKIDEETGYLWMQGMNGNNVTTNWSIQTGHVTIEFEEITLTKGNLFINFWPKGDVGDANYNITIYPDGNFEIRTGGGFGWQKLQKTKIEGGIAAMKKLEFTLDVDPENDSKLIFKTFVNGQPMVGFTGSTNIYKANPEHEGNCVNVQIKVDVNPTDHYTLKSVSYKPVK